MTTNPSAEPAWRTQFALDFEGEINVDLFAGGGGASTGLEMGLDRPVQVAINHDGRRFTLTAQPRMCGNSVSPLPMTAIAQVNRVDQPVTLQAREAS